MTHDDVIDRIDAARERDRSFAGLRARVAAARAAASADLTETAAIVAVADLLEAELDTPAAESERVTGLDAVAADVQTACVDALAETPWDDPSALAAALPVLARACHRGRTAAIRETAAEACLHAMVEADAIPADVVPVADFETAFEAGSRGVRAHLSARRYSAHGDGGVFARAAVHAPERAPGIVRWLLRVEDFELVNTRLAFEWEVARILKALDGERASAVLDVVLDHLDHETADYRRTAAGALGESPAAVPDDRVVDALDAAIRRFDDGAFSIPEDAVGIAVALLERAAEAAERTFDRLRADAPTGAVLDGLRGLDDADPAVREQAVEFLLSACDGEATGRVASRLGEHLAGDGTHRWGAVGRALVAGAAAEAAADDPGRARASSKVAALAPGVDEDDANRVRALAAVASDAAVDGVRAFVALVPPPRGVDASAARERCLRDVVVACLRAARAADASRRRRARLAAELLADVLQTAMDAGDGEGCDEAASVSAATTVGDALRAVGAPADATAESVAARTRLVEAVPGDASVQEPSTLAGLLGHADADVRERALALLAAGRVDDIEEAVSVLAERFVDRLATDSEGVRQAAVDAAPAVVDLLPAAATGRVVDALVERAASEGERRQRRAIAALADVGVAIPDEHVDRVVTLGLLGLRSDDTGTRTVAADLLVAVVPRVPAVDATAVTASVVAATEAYADVVFDGIEVLWALAEAPGTGLAVARAFARTLTASRVARDHLADASIGFEVTTAQVQRVVDGLVGIVAADDGDGAAGGVAAADAATALDVVARMLPANRVEMVVHALAHAATDDDAAVRSAVFEAFESVAAGTAGETPAGAWTPLGELLVHDRARVRRGAFVVLTAMLDAGGDSSAVAASAREATTESPAQVKAPKALGSGAADALPSVLDAGMDDEAAVVRIAATRAVAAAACATVPGTPDDAWALAGLSDRATDDAARVRLAAVEALHRVLDARDADGDGASAAPTVRDVLADRVAGDPDAAVREASVEVLLGTDVALADRESDGDWSGDGDEARSRLDAAAVALGDDDAAVRETAVAALPEFLERADASLGLRSRAVVHLGERVSDDDAASVRRAAADAAGQVAASVVDEFGARDPESDDAGGEWPPGEWVRDALADDDAAVRAAIVDRLPAFAAALDGSTAAVAARYLVVARREDEAWPTDRDLAALAALAERVDAAALSSVESYVLADIEDAEGERLSALAVALGAIVEGRSGVANDVVETLLDRIATAPRPTGAFGERMPSPQADAARDVLVVLVDAFPETFGSGVDPDVLRLYVGHERDAVCAAAGRVLAAVHEHGDDPDAAIGTPDDLRATLVVDDLPEPARLAVLAMLADGTLLARTQRAARDR